jgi:hypothetical protein
LLRDNQMAGGFELWTENLCCFSCSARKSSSWARTAHWIRGLGRIDHRPPSSRQFEQMPSLSTCFLTWTHRLWHGDLDDH